MLAEITLATLRRTERALGPAAVVGVVRAAIETSDGALRRTLLLAGIGAALRAEDAGAALSFVSHWELADDEEDRRALSLVARLAEQGRFDTASALARAEHARRASAESAFALAAMAAREGRSDEAGALFGEAARRAGSTPLAERAQRMAIAQQGPERAEEAEAQLARSTHPREVLRLAPTALTCSRLYARIRTLDRLGELASDPGTRLPALRIALAFVDRRGAFLGELERDRVRAIATRAGADVAILDALAGRTTTSEAAAREALMGHAPESEGHDRGTTLGLRALAAMVAENGSASLLLSALSAHAPTAPGWIAVQLGLASVRTRDVAIGLAERWISLGLAPPRGFSVLADALDRAGASAPSERAWMEAIRACEPGARHRVGNALEVRARIAYEDGDRLGARALLERSLAIDPD